MHVQRVAARELGHQHLRRGGQRRRRQAAISHAGMLAEQGGTQLQGHCVKASPGVTCGACFPPAPACWPPLPWPVNALNMYLRHPMHECVARSGQKRQAAGRKGALAGAVATSCIGQSSKGTLAAASPAHPPHHDHTNHALKKAASLLLLLLTAGRACRLTAGGGSGGSCCRGRHGARTASCIEAKHLRPGTRRLQNKRGQHPQQSTPLLPEASDWFLLL